MNWNTRIDQIIKRVTVPATFVSAALIAAGFAAGRLGVGAAMVFCYLLAAFLCAVPVAVRAVQGLQRNTVSIEVLVSIAVLGALLLRQFGEAAMVTFLFQFGHFLEQRTVKKSRDAVSPLEQADGDATPVQTENVAQDVRDAKLPEKKFADWFVKWYTAAVTTLAALVLVLTWKPDMAVAVLMLACPGALVVGVPAANAAGIRRGAKEQVLIKDGGSLSAFAGTTVFAFAKTGTLTEGRPGVTFFRYYEEDWKNAMLLADAMERGSDHPISRAIQEYAEKLETVSEEALSVQVEKGKGIRAQRQGENLVMGSVRYAEELNVQLTQQVRSDLSLVQEPGDSAVILAAGERVLALFGISDRIREDAAQSLKELKSLGADKLILLTGDNGLTARIVAKEAGIDEVYAELKPQEKPDVIERLQSKGSRVAYVGNGVSDSSALAAAKTGIVMGTGTDAAVGTADVVLNGSDMMSLPRAWRLARRTAVVRRINVAIAMGTVILLLAGLFAGVIHLAGGMFVHEAGVLAVILNAMRILYGSEE